MSDDEVDVYTVAQVADRLQWSKTTIISLIDSCELGAKVRGKNRRSIRIPKQSLAAYLETKLVAAKSLPSKEVADLRIARFMRGAS